MPKGFLEEGTDSVGRVWGSRVSRWRGDMALGLRSRGCGVGRTRLEVGRSAEVSHGRFWILEQWEP